MSEMHPSPAELVELEKGTHFFVGGEHRRSDWVDGKPVVKRQEIPVRSATKGLRMPTAERDERAKSWQEWMNKD
ncbi:MAG: hypothetical protein NTY75_01920 [Candidatus Shapirobacteria bacterium]|nr:hypothetical protein [Candidatus Shapirobacteria bacterium]